MTEDLKRARWPGLTFGMAILLAAGCSKNAHLSPAPTASQLPGRVNAAVAAAAGVRVTAQTGVWTGLPSVRDSVTPVMVEVENRSGGPIRICYDEFTLTSADGRVYAALPPYDVQGTADAPVLVKTYPAVTPLFSHRAFWIAPYYSRVYPDMTAFPGAFPFHPYYYRSRYAYWATLSVSLPTPEMLRQALPEGVLGDDGSVAGFLYFQRVDPDERAVTMSAQIVDAHEGREIGRVSIPFRVEAKTAALRREGRDRNEVQHGHA